METTKQQVIDEIVEILNDLTLHGVEKTKKMILDYWTRYANTA